MTHATPPGTPGPGIPPVTTPLPTGPAYPGPPPPGWPGGPAEGHAAPVVAVPDGTGPAQSRLTAGLLGVFLGGVGAHRFYLGYPSMGVLQVLVTISTLGLGGLWGFTEGIVILSGKGFATDADGRPLRS